MSQTLNFNTKRLPPRASQTSKTAASPMLGGLILSTPHTVLPKSLKSNIFANMPKRTDCDRGAQKQPNNKRSQILWYQKPKINYIFVKMLTTHYKVTRMRPFNFGGRQ